MNTNTKKDIKINSIECKDQYGDDLYEQLIETIVQRDYEEKKFQIEEALKNKDAKNLKYVCHTFKTTARMLCIEDFALECQAIETLAVQENVDWIQMQKLVEEFLVDFHSVYIDANQIYESEFKKEMETIEEKDEIINDLNEKLHSNNGNKDSPIITRPINLNISNYINNSSITNTSSISNDKINSKIKKNLM